MSELVCILIPFATKYETSCSSFKIIFNEQAYFFSKRPERNRNYMLILHRVNDKIDRLSV